MHAVNNEARNIMINYIKNKFKEYYKKAAEYYAAAIKFIWEWVHLSTNNIMAKTIEYTIAALSLACAIYAGFLIFNILALTAMPVWLIYIIAIIASLPLLGAIELHHPIGFCAVLFCSYSFIIAGNAIAPAILAAVALGFLAEAVLYGAHAFFEIEVIRHPKIDGNKINTFILQDNESKTKYMLAQIIAIAVMILIFKLTSAAIITAVTPYAVAILGAVGVALGVIFCTQHKHPYDMFKNNFIVGYAISVTKAIESYKKPKPHMAHPLIIAAFAALATFIVLVNFPLALIGAPMLIAALAAVSIGIAAQQTIIYAPAVASKAVSHVTGPKPVVPDAGEQTKEPRTSNKLQEQAVHGNNVARTSNELQEEEKQNTSSTLEL